MAILGLCKTDLIGNTYRHLKIKERKSHHRRKQRQTVFLQGFIQVAKLLRLPHCLSASQAHATRWRMLPQVQHQNSSGPKNSSVPLITYHFIDKSVTFSFSEQECKVGNRAQFLAPPLEKEDKHVFPTVFLKSFV